MFNFDIKIVLRKIWIVFLDEMCLWNYFFCIFFFFYFSDFLKATYIGSVDYQVTQEKVHLKEFRVKKLNLWYIFKYSWFIEKYFCKNLNGIIEIILFFQGLWSCHLMEGYALWSWRMKPQSPKAKSLTKALDQIVCTGGPRLMRISLLWFFKTFHKYLTNANFGIFVSLVRFLGQNIWLMQIFWLFISLLRYALC